MGTVCRYVLLGTGTVRGYGTWVRYVGTVRGYGVLVQCTHRTCFQKMWCYFQNVALIAAHFGNSTTFSEIRYHEKHGKWIIFWYGFNHLYNIIQLQVDKWWLMDDYHILSFHREGNHKFLLGYSWYKIGWEYDVQKRWFVWGQPPQDEWMCQGRWIAVVQTENWQYYGV